VIRRAAAAAFATVALAGCGGSEGLTPFEENALLDHVGEARDAARARDRAGVERSLAELRREVDRLRAAGEIDDASARRLDAAADDTLRAADSTLEGGRGSARPEPTPLIETEPTPSAAPEDVEPLVEPDDQLEDGGKPPKPPKPPKKPKKHGHGPKKAH
jgi:hypothetical protein